MTTGYLLDTNVISAALQPGHAKHEAVIAHLKAKNGYVSIPALAVAEIEFGLACAERPLSTAAAAAHAEIRRFCASLVQWPFDRHTVEPYTIIRAQLWRDLGTRGRRGFKEKHPEDLVDRVTGKELEIDEKDLQIVAIAVQHNYVLATVDRNAKMERIEAAAKTAESQGHPVKLKVEDWGLPV